MPRRAPLLTVPAVLLTAALALGACGDGDDGGDGVSATETAIATDTESSATFVSIPTETPPRTVVGPDIRQEDPTQQPELSEFLSGSGGVVDPNMILYADLTDDGSEEAIVPVSSGGEGGNIAVFVFGYIDGQVTQLLRRETDTSLTASFAEDELRVTEPVFAEGDPFACPSQLKSTRYEWDGAALVVADESTEPNPC